MSVEVQTPTGTAPQQVFICYRREETAPYAGRIYDAMVSRFGVENVFMDLDLAPGVDFVDRITRVVSGCVALIVVIGPSWADLQNEDGSRRIEDPDDFVRLEVETGLRRDDVTLIPVLVGGARMPRREDLPPELQKMARRNALELSNGRWKHDVGRLLGTLDEVLPDAATPPEPQTPPPYPPPSMPEEPPPLGWRLVSEGMLIAGLSAAAGRLLGEAFVSFKEAADDEVSSLIVNHIATEVGRRTLTLTLVGVALAVWLALRVRRVDPARPVLRGLSFGLLAGVLGGLVFSLLLYLPSDKVEFPQRGWIEMASLAVSGSVLGALIGGLWLPRRAGTGLALGALGAVLFYILVLVLSWRSPTMGERVLIAGLGIAAVVGLTLAVLLALDRGEARERRAAAGPT